NGQDAVSGPHLAPRLARGSGRPEPAVSPAVRPAGRTTADKAPDQMAIEVTGAIMPPDRVTLSQRDLGGVDGATCRRQPALVAGCLRGLDRPPRGHEGANERF